MTSEQQEKAIACLKVLVIARAAGILELVIVWERVIALLEVVDPDFFVPITDPAVDT